jgi:hypothetical protein
MLPVGYLEMGRDDYAALDVETARAVYRALAEIVGYTMGRAARGVAVRDVWIARGVELESVTPADWIMTLKSLTCKCARCNGSGVYSWGACINGCMSHSAPCARCNGKGQMDFDDMRRGRAYDSYAIARACRG